MPKRAIIVRHAESTSNANEPTEDFDAVALSERGRSQAEALAERFPFVPEFLIHSRFPRTRETALPLLRKYPGIPTDVWSIHEFVPFSKERLRGTRMADHKAWIDAYWLRADPDEADDSDTESFRSLVGRVEEFLRMLEAAPDIPMAIVSHGRFLRVLEAYFAHGPSDLASLMRFSRLSDPIPNASMLEFEFDSVGKPIAIRRLPHPLTA